MWVSVAVLTGTRRESQQHLIGSTPGVCKGLQRSPGGGGLAAGAQPRVGKLTPPDVFAGTGALASMHVASCTDLLRCTNTARFPCALVHVSSF